MHSEGAFLISYDVGSAVEVGRDQTRAVTAY